MISRNLLALLFAVILVVFGVFGGARESAGPALENTEADAQLKILDEEGNIILTADHIASANAGQYDMDGTKTYYVNVILTEEGKGIFADATKRMLGKRLAVYLGDECILNPVVQSQITDGQIMISGLKSLEEAGELAKKLNK